MHLVVQPSKEVVTIPEYTHIWLIDDIGGEIHTALSLYTVRVSCFTSKLSSTPQRMKELIEMLNRQKPTLVWVTLHGSPTSGTEPRCYRKQMDCVISICNAQLAAGRHLILYASERNYRVWENSMALKQLLQAQHETLTKFTGRMCNLGIKRPSDGRPSDRLQRVVSSTSLSTLNPTCNCGADVKLHVQDGDAMSEDRRNGDRKAIVSQMATEIAALILRSLFGSSALCSRRPLGAATGRDLAESRQHDERRIQPKSFNYQKSNINHSESNESNCLMTTEEKQLEPLDETADASYPTEAAIRAKERHKVQQAIDPDHAKGVKKRKFEVEQHFDDCGRDDSSLKEALWSMAPETLYLDAELRDREDDSELMDELAQSCLTGFYGAGIDPSFRADGTDARQASRTRFHQTGSPAAHTRQHCTDFMTFLSQWHLPTQGNAYVDVAELCGGQATTSLVLVHRYHHLNVGKNFDISVGIDLLSMKEVSALWKYLAQSRVHVVIMSVPCTGMAGWQRLNRITNRASWEHSRETSVPLGRLAGQVAEYQLRRKRHFISEHPQTTEMYHLDEWAYARNHPSLAWCVIHQCMTGLVDYKEPHLHIKKATELWASDERLVAPLRRFWCDGSHEHERAKGETAHRARLWTWQFASAIAAGINDVITQSQPDDTVRTYAAQIATTPLPYYPDVGTEVSSVTAEDDRDRGDRGGRS